MNIQELLSRAGINSPEVEAILIDAINQELAGGPWVPVADPIQAEEDEWLEPLNLGGTMIVRGDL